MLSDWFLSIEGTEAGRQVALGLALLAALMHAALGALQKGRHDPWLTRGAVDLWASAISVPLILFVVPPPSAALWILLPGAMAVHFAYKWVLAMAYERGAFTAVYPIVRGTGPLATVVIAGVVFGEFFSAGQWAGIALLSGGIFALAAINLRRERIDPARLRAAIGLAFVTGMITALYTVYDAYAIRTAADPFTFVCWFFFLEAFNFAPFLWRRFAAQRNELRAIFLRGFVGALFAYVSFSSIFLATRLDKVGEAASLRETSVIFAAIFGWLFLGETIGKTRSLIMVVIAAGAILVEFG